MATAFDMDHWMIAWNPGPAATVEVGPWPDTTGWSSRYPFAAGCCYARWHKLTHEKKLEQMIRGIVYLALTYGLEPQAIHRELSKVDGYLDYHGEIGLGIGEYGLFQNGRMDPSSPREPML